MSENSLYFSNHSIFRSEIKRRTLVCWSILQYFSLSSQIISSDVNCLLNSHFLAQNHWFIQTISKRCKLHWVEYNYQTISIVFRRLKLCPEIMKHFKLLHWVIVDDLFVNLNLLATLFKLICEYLNICWHDHIISCFLRCFARVSFFSFSALNFFGRLLYV